MNKKELLDKKIEQLLRVSLNMENAKEVFEDIKKKYPEIIDERLIDDSHNNDDLKRK